MGFVQGTANNINFHYRTNSVKINEQILDPFSQFWEQKNFSPKIRSSNAQNMGL